MNRSAYRAGSPMYKVVDEASHHFRFKDVSFPRLQRLKVSCPPGSDVDNGLVALMPYLEPGLKEVDIYRGALSDDFFYP